MKKGAITSHDPNVFVTVARIIILPAVNNSEGIYVYNNTYYSSPINHFLQSNSYKIQTRVSNLTLYNTTILFAF